MNALELKQKIKSWDNNKAFFKVVALSVLITAVFFPFNLWLNPAVDPVVYEHPILLGFGFVAITLMFLVFFVGGIVFTMILLDSYLFLSPKVLDSYGRFNAHSVLRDSEVTNKMATGIHKTLKRLRLDDFTFQIDEVKKGLLFEINELKQDNKNFENRLTSLEIELEKERSLRKKYEQLLNDRTLTQTDTSSHNKFKDIDE